MDSPQPSTSSCDSLDLRDAGNGEGLAVAEIMRMKEKRLKLLDDYRNGQEENIAPLMREAEDITKKRKKRPRVQLNGENNTPLRRSERIMTLTLNENGTVESPVRQSRKKRAPMPAFEPEPELMDESEPESEPMPEFEPEPAPMDVSEPGPAPRALLDREPVPMPEFEPEPALTDESEPESEFVPEPYLVDDSDSDSDPEDDFAPPPPRRVEAEAAEGRAPSPGPENEADHSGRHIFDIRLASRRVFAVHPAPRRSLVPVSVPAWSRSPSNPRENWYGEREGFDIGHHWNTRLECSHDRVHRPSIAGIHAGPQGAYSVALSGAYPEDVDEGNTVIFTGAGGRNLKGAGGRSRSVRGAPQVRDQELNKANLSLIRSVLTGNPVRLIRGHKMASSFAPERGYRYDGLYRVVQYNYTPGHSGFRVFKFRMHRIENQSPPPWETGWLAAIPRRPPAQPPRDQSPPARDPTPPRRNSTPPPNNGPQVPEIAGELEREIIECIIKLCLSSSYELDDDDQPPAVFRGFDTP